MELSKISHIPFKALQICSFLAFKHGNSTRIIQLHLEVSIFMIFSSNERKRYPSYTLWLSRIWLTWTIIHQEYCRSRFITELLPATLYPWSTRGQGIKQYKSLRRVCSWKQVVGHWSVCPVNAKTLQHLPLFIYAVSGRVVPLLTPLLAIVYTHF